MRDLATKEDIAFLVEKFYQSIHKNKFLRPFFENINFKEHLPRMIHFWSFILHDEAGYITNVTEKHIRLPLKKFILKFGWSYSTKLPIFILTENMLIKQKNAQL